MQAHTTHASTHSLTISTHTHTHTFTHTQPQSSNKPEQLNLDKKQPNFTGLAAWVGSAVAFGLGIWATMGQDSAEQYFAGYLLEQSLSVDNLFVFLLVFSFFKTPEAAQVRAWVCLCVSANVLLN